MASRQAHFTLLALLLALVISMVGCGPTATPTSPPPTKAPVAQPTAAQPLATKAALPTLTTAPAASTPVAAQKAWYDPKQLTQSWWHMCPNTPPKQGGSLYTVWSATGAWGSGANFFTEWADQRLFSQLFDQDPDGATYVPDAATSWNVSADGKTYTFKLRNDVLFHNGSKMTAEDVKFSMELEISPGTANRYAPQLPVKAIVGAQDFMDGKAKEISGITAPDATTLVIQLAEPRSNFLDGMRQFNIFPKQLLKDIPFAELKNSEYAVKKPVGSGPFQQTEFVPSEYAVLSAFDKYFKGRANLDKIVVRLNVTQWLPALENGEIQAGLAPISAGPDYDRLKANPNISLVCGPVAGGTTAAINHEGPWTKDVRVRKALLYALDRKTLAKTYYGELAAPLDLQMNNSAYFGPNFVRYEFNPDKAKQLLKEAGYDPNYTLRFWSAYQDDTNKRLFAAMQQMWADVGIKVQVTTAESGTVIERVFNQRDFDLYYGCCGWNDPAFLNTYFAENYYPKGSNYMHWNNPQYEKLVSSALIEPDPAKQKALWIQVTDLMSDQLLNLPMLQLTRCQAISSNVCSYAYHQFSEPQPSNFPELWYLAK